MSSFAQDADSRLGEIAIEAFRTLT